MDKVIATIRARIKTIKDDPRFSYPPAQVQINAPLALIQVEMKAKVSAYEVCIALLEEART